jgi:hypothetical protein
VDDLRPLLDQALAAVPGKYRVAVVLCDLEGKTHREAARQLGWPQGTLASRLSRGRKLLAARLSRRGVVASAGALAAVLSEGLASAGVPALLASSTIHAACFYQAGQAAAPVKVAALTEGVLKAMSLNKIKAVVAVLLLAGVAVLGGGLLTRGWAEADLPGVKKQGGPMPAAPGAVRAGKPAPAPGEDKGRLEVTADGKQVRVLAVFRGVELRASADRMSYNEESSALILEAFGGRRVRVEKRSDPDQKPEVIEAEKVTLNRKTGVIEVQGTGKIEPAAARTGGAHLAVPMLGPVPIALDFGFPVEKRREENQQIFNFYSGFTR